MMMVPTYPEDDSRVLKVYQEHQQVCRVAHQVLTFEIGGTIVSRSRLRRPIRLEPSRYHSAQSALCDTVKVASAGTSVRACAMTSDEMKIGG